MSGILVKNRCFVRNLRKSFLYLSPSYSSVRVTNPRLHLIARHQRCFANLAVKHTENGNYAENSESLAYQSSAPATVENAIFDLDDAARRTGRVPHPLVEKAFSLAINSGQVITSVQSLYLLRSCGLMLRETPETRVKLADEVWRELEKLGCHFDIRHYNSLLKIYVDSYHQITPSDFLVRLESNNVEPNRVTLLYLMEKYCNDGNLNGASEILEYLKEKGFSVNESVFSALITGHMRVNDVSGAMEIFDVMRSSNLTPSSQSYLALACGHAWNGNIEGVKSTIQEAESNGVAILNEDYLSILSSISTDDHLPYVDEVINVFGNSVLNLKQSILNTAFGLINKGASESAYRLILSISTDEDSARLNTNVFLNHLSKTNQPIEKMLRFLNDISEKNLNSLAWLNCAKGCIDVEQFDKAFVIFEEMIKRGHPVRSHHIWPIFPKLKSEKEIFLTLKRMFDLGLPADHTTFIKGVLPGIDVSDPERVFRKIEETGQTRTAAYDALFIHYTQNGQSSNAMYIAKKYPVFVPPEFNLKKFLMSHSETEVRDVYSPFHEVLAFVIENMGKNLRLSGDLKGEFFANLISLNPSAFLFWVRRAKEEGFQLNRRSIDVCRSILSQKNPKLMNHVHKLEDLSFNQQPRNTRITTIEEEDRELQRLEEKGLRTDLFMQQLLQQHVRNKNLDRINHLKSELERSNVELTPVTLYSLFHFHKEKGDIQEAEKYLRTLSEKYPDFDVDTAQILEFASLLIKFSKFDDALDILKSNCKVLRINGSRDFLYRATRKFFEFAIESGNIDFLKNAQSHLLTVFTDRNYGKMMYEPLVKMHLFRNNLDDAVKEFKSLVHDKKVAPHTIQLMKKCITSDDHKTLETVIETASVLDGKVPVLQDLSLAFLELGRKDQAAQVLENLGRKVQSSFVANTCSKFLGDRSVSKLEDFLFAFKTVDGVDLTKGFSLLFKLYDLENDAYRALSIYNEIKHISLDNSTKRILINLLERMKVDVPSGLRESTGSVIVKTKVEEDNEVTGKPTDPIIGEFREVLEKGDTALALEKLDSMKKGHIRSLSLSEMTRLVDLVIEKKLGQDLSRNVQVMSYIIEYGNEVLNSLLTKYSEVGDVESLHHVANFMPDFSLKPLAFNGFLCKAYLVSGKHAELLTEMENRVDKKNRIFSAISFLELLNHPDLKERAINLAKQYSEIKFYSPMTMVWAHYLINGNYDAADKLEEGYQVQGDKADSIILRALRKSENPTLGRKFIDNLNKHNTRIRHKERAYGALLDVLVLQEKYDEAVNLVAESKEKNVELEKHFRSTLVTLKAALERENKPVPFVIPSEESILPV